MARIRLAFVLLLAACGSHAKGNTDASVDGGYVPDACEGLRCFQGDCAVKGLPPTTITGTVYAPNGTLPLYGVDVYVPETDPGPLADGVQCSQCDKGLQGGALTQTKTDEAGHFVLENVPATSNVPVVVQVGKWRRQFTIQNVAACESMPIPPEQTRLPKDQTEGDLPKIAISTGAADALECLILRLGISKSEFTPPTGTGRVHMYTNVGIPVPTSAPPSGGRGTDRFATNWPVNPGASFGDSRDLWKTEASLSAYDIVVLSCEGSQYPASKLQTDMDAVKAYADKGGRIFLSHWHNIWIAGESGNSMHGITDWENVATWNFGAAQNETTQLDIVDETVPKGPSFATWLQNVGASTVRDQIQITEPRYTCTANDPMKSERWVYVDPTLSTPLGKTSVQDLLFTTPQDKMPEARCGKVVFSDMHVSSGSVSGAGASGPIGFPFASGCSTADLTAQEKALAFIFFDISSCVGTIF